MLCWGLKLLSRIREILPVWGQRVSCFSAGLLSPLLMCFNHFGGRLKVQTTCPCTIKVERICIMALSTLICILFLGFVLIAVTSVAQPGYMMHCMVRLKWLTCQMCDKWIPTLSSQLSGVFSMLQLQRKWQFLHWTSPGWVEGNPGWKAW